MMMSTIKMAPAKPSPDQAAIRKAMRGPSVADVQSVAMREASSNAANCQNSAPGYVADRKNLQLVRNLALEALRRTLRVGRWDALNHQLCQSCIG
jgi:hypothetical protein